MSALLTFFGWWCIVSAMFGSGWSFKLTGRNIIAAVDVLFGMSGIGVLFLLLARMLA